MWRGLLRQRCPASAVTHVPSVPVQLGTHFGPQPHPGTLQKTRGGKLLQMRMNPASVQIAQSPVQLLSMSVGFLQLPPTVCVCVCACVSCVGLLFPTDPRDQGGVGSYLATFHTSSFPFQNKQLLQTFLKKTKLHPNFKNQALTVKIQNTDIVHSLDCGKKSSPGVNWQAGRDLSLLPFSHPRSSAKCHQIPNQGLSFPANQAGNRDVNNDETK